MKNNKIEQLRSVIAKGVRQLSEHEAFKQWVKDKVSGEKGLIIINNSFIYRKPLIKTTKSKRYLCMRYEQCKIDPDGLEVYEPGFEVDTDFKWCDDRSQNMPQGIRIDDAVQQELKKLGRLVFVLIGTIEEEVCEVAVNSSPIAKIRLDPSVVEPQWRKDESAITVPNVYDMEAVWELIESNNLVSDRSEARSKLESAFEKLQSEARFRLRLPTSNDDSEKTTTFIGRIIHSVSRQKEEYEQALTAKHPDMREVMRIAYNFACDAIKLLKLLVGIADLKPVLLWGTIYEHYRLAEAFRCLPWIDAQKKPPLERYREIIGGARNRHFHNLLDFDRTIVAELEGVNLIARQLTLLPAHGKHKNMTFLDYEDREIVELLSELTRATETKVSHDFWEKNLQVITCFEHLLKKTEEVLRILTDAGGEHNRT